MIHSPKMLPSAVVCQRYGIVRRTLERWVRRPDLEFPSPMVVNSRRYWLEADLAEWERSRARYQAPIAA